MKINEEANRLIQETMKKHPNTKLTIGILHKGKTTYKLFDSSGEIPYESHLYEMGSIGKTFTISLLAKYIDQGKMNLEDSVSKYIPELDDGNYYPTLRRLATHTAGYPEDYEAENVQLICKLIWKGWIRRKQLLIQDIMNMDKEKMIHLAKNRKLENKDYSWEYSNFGISLLGHAISNIAGKDFFTLMTEFMNQELKLKNTFMGTNYNKLIKGYDKKSREIKPWFVDEYEHFIPAGAGMLSNAEDLLHYAKMNIEERPNYLNICHDYYASGSKRSGNMDMALGWWMNTKE
ncbi:MAG: beta-lactamase family protein, partial [Oscillospiraceae bacterium]|nr:beta-lactamase family protein [Oscillospiraceae bacterium]